MRFIKLKEVLDMTGRSRTATYEDIALRKFPAPVKNGKSSHWIDDEITEWMQARINERNISLS